MPDESPDTSPPSPPEKVESLQEPDSSGLANPVKDVMNVEEIAAYLGFSVDTIYKKVQTREIPFTRIGNVLRFTRRSIDQWLDRNTETPNEALYDQVARLLNRYHFQKWLEGRGVDWKTLTEEGLTAAARAAIEDLRKTEGVA